MGQMNRLDQLDRTDKTWIVVVIDMSGSRELPNYHGPFPTERDALEYAKAVPKFDEFQRTIRAVGHIELTVNTEWLIASHANLKP